MMDSWIASITGLAMPLDRSALRQWQLGRLNQVLDYARSRSRFYKERFPKSKVHSFEEFADFPFTSAEDVTDHGASMICVKADEIARIVSILMTSGSEGAPKKIRFSAADQEKTIDYFLHGMMEFAVPKDRALILFPGQSPGSLNVLLKEALSRMDVDASIFGFPLEKDYERVINTILDEKRNRVIGPAPVIAAIARQSEALGVSSAAAEIVDSVLLAGSFVSDENCQIISRLWKCRIDEEYGMTETGFGGGVGCRIGKGYHVWESDLYYEVIDPSTLRPVPAGTFGELVVTTLRREAMPFLRYRTGDISRILPGKCPCGSALLHMDRVHSRATIKKYLRPGFDDKAPFISV